MVSYPTSRRNVAIHGAFVINNGPDCDVEGDVQCSSTTCGFIAVSATPMAIDPNDELDWAREITWNSSQ